MNFPGPNVDKLKGGVVGGIKIPIWLVGGECFQSSLQAIFFQAIFEQLFCHGAWAVNSNRDCILFTEHLYFSGNENSSFVLICGFNPSWHFAF